MQRGIRNQDRIMYVILEPVQIFPFPFWPWSMFSFYIISVSDVSTKLRQYEILEQLQMQDKWVVQLRQRQKGGAKGDIYYVYVSPQGRLRYTKSLDWGVTSIAFYHSIGLQLMTQQST